MSLARCSSTPSRITAFRYFPTNHGQKISSTNSLEPLNFEITRRTNVVGIFPNDSAALLITAVDVDQHDEWSVSKPIPLSGVHGSLEE